LQKIKYRRHYFLDAVEDTGPYDPEIMAEKRRQPVLRFSAPAVEGARSSPPAALPSSVMNSRRFTARFLPCFRQKE
jgi:hypothetical protein